MTPNDGTVASNSRTKTRFARRFLRSLSKMRKARPSSSSSSSSSMCMSKRSERIKRAAYWCMARAVGSRRAWSRAILMKLSRSARQHHHHHHNLSLTMKRRRSTWLGGKKINKNRKKKKKILASSSACAYSCNEIPADDEGEGEDEGHMKRQTKKLREIVPGGKLMDICSLLEETAHFVGCLNTQVNVMQSIAHHYSK